MKTLVLLGNVFGDWLDANQCRVDAEALWRITRNWHPEGADETTDRYMQEICEELDALIEVLDEEELQALQERDEAVANEEELQGHDEAVANVVEQHKI
jgi:hypothetical protein